MNKEQHNRTVLLLGEEKFEKLQKAHVLIVGLGGVGGYAAEQIARTGIGKLTLIDSDIVNESNLNRQIIALHSTLGKNKTSILSNRLKDINPEISIQSENVFINEENIETVLQKTKPDYVIDAIDTLMPKVNLIKTCLKLNIPLVSSMGAGGRLNPEKVHISDISKTYNCGLARMLRKRLHKFNIRTGFKAVFSSEKVNRDVIIEEKSQNKKTNVGTVSYMPAIFGMFCASVVIQDLID
ncbi:MAG: tRNA threonylcarbamoyladenosine dehydratase [Bacteroidetes bacterium]|nr:MAG: tRNA threonylcarbamoyladenosine dehydratase [Bacteroidota bacterium]